MLTFVDLCAGEEMRWGNYLHILEFGSLSLCSCWSSLLYTPASQSEYTNEMFWNKLKEFFVYIYKTTNVVYI